MDPVTFEWGPTGLAAAAGRGRVVVVVDVLRFTTAVEAAASRGAEVLPYRWRDATAARYAAEQGATLADDLSPVGLVALAPGARVVLPSPNGSTCAAVARESGATVVAACLRNAAAVAAWLADRPVTVVAAGERWPDGSLRPCLEDLLGAGAVVAALPEHLPRSPDARAAAAAWRDAQPDVADLVAGCPSGQEQVTRGWSSDLAYATATRSSPVVPVLTPMGFRDGGGRGEGVSGRGRGPRR